MKDPAEKPGYVEAFKRSDFAAMMNYYRANYPKISGADGAPPPAIPPINVPVLVIHGLKDKALNAAGHSGTWDHVTADTTLLMIPSAGHFVQHDAQDLGGPHHQGLAGRPALTAAATPASWRRTFRPCSWRRNRRRR